MTGSNLSVSRRRLLRTVPAAATVGVAGCSGLLGDEDGENGADGTREERTDAPTEEAIETETETEGPTETDTEEETETETPDPPQFDIADVTYPPEVDRDEGFEVAIEVANVGGRSGESEVVLSIGNAVSDDTVVELDSGETESVGFTVDSNRIEEGDYTIDVSTPDDAYSASLTVKIPNPWGKDTLRVGLEQRVHARHDIHDIVEEALEYWDENSEIYTEYSISYQYRPNSDDPDVLIVLVDDIVNCGGHTGEIAGCAPLIQDQAPATAEIRIVDGYRPEWMISTLKHEIGHTLGLDHDDEPLHIMSNEIEDRIPNYQDRNEAIQRYVDSFDPYSDGNTRWNDATDAWSRGNYSETESAAVDAHNSWLEARNLIDEAAEIVTDLEEEEAIDLMAESHLHVENLRLAADAAIEMARAADNGNSDRVEDYRGESNQYLDEARSYELQDPEDLAVALGFRM